MNSEASAKLVALEIVKWVILIGFNIIGGLGLLLVVYGFAHEADPQRYSLGAIDDTVTLVSQVMALIGVIVTTYSIYFPVHSRAPHPGSKYVTVPIVMTPLLLFGVYHLFTAGQLPELSINGYVILGFAGAVFRLIPYTFRSTDRTRDAGDA